MYDYNRVQLTLGRVTWHVSDRLL